MHVSTHNESCDKVLKSIAFCLTKWLEKVSVSSCQKLLHCLNWTQCEKQTEQQNYIQMTTRSMKQETSSQHGSLGIPARTHIWNGRWTGSKGLKEGSNRLKKKLKCHILKCDKQKSLINMLVWPAYRWSWSLGKGKSNASKATSEAKNYISFTAWSIFVSI